MHLSLSTKRDKHKLSFSLMLKGYDDVKRMGEGRFRRKADAEFGEEKPMDESWTVARNIG